MTMPGRVVAGAVGYRYGFNGKEQDRTEWGGPVYDYGFRIYDARVGRFLSVDPLRMKYPELTPYQFASNTPIQAIDLDGLEKEEMINAFKWGANKTKQLVVQTVEGVGSLVVGTLTGDPQPLINVAKGVGQTGSDVSYLAKTWVDIVYGQATGKPAEVDTEKFHEKAHDLGKGIVKTAVMAPLTEVALGTANVVPKVLQSGKPIVKAEVAAPAAPVVSTAEVAVEAAKGVANFNFKDLSSFRGANSAVVAEWLEQNGWSGVKTNPNRVYNDGMRYTNGVRGEQIRIMPGGITRSIPEKTGPYMEISLKGKKTVIELEGNPTLK